MRILHLSSLYAPYFYGGAERVVQVVAEGLAARDVDVGVAHLAPTRQPNASLNGVKVFPLAHRNPLWIETSAQHSTLARNFNKLATLLNVMTARDVAELLDQFKPEIVHTHSMVELTPLVWKIAKDRGVKIVHTLHDFDLLCIRGALFKDGRRCQSRHKSCAMFSEVKKHFHTRIDHVIGPSQSILDIHRNFGLFSWLDATKQHVIWNPGMTTAAPRSLSRRHRDGPFTFGFLGRLVPEKGIHVLLEACRQLGDSEWELRIAGRAPAGDADLRAKAAGMPVTFLGFVKPDSFFAEIDVLIAPILWSEPFGMTVVEALAAGVPVIGSELGGVGEVIGSVNRDWLVPPGDAVALAKRMSALIRSGRASADALPDLAPVVDRTSHAFVVARYMEVYQAAALN